LKERESKIDSQIAERTRWLPMVTGPALKLFEQVLQVTPDFARSGRGRHGAVPRQARASTRKREIS